MAKQAVQPDAGLQDAVSAGNRRVGRWGVRLLEGVIVFLVGLNAYLVYTVATSAALPSSGERPAEAVLDPSVFQIQVEILNGCGERGIGQEVMRFLRARGFDVVHIGNADHFAYRETIVLDRSGKPGPSKAALAVGTALGTPNVLHQRNDARMVDVSVVVGKDFDELLFHDEKD